MDEIFDRIRAIKIKKGYLRAALIYTELLGILVLLWFLRAPLSQKFLTIPPKAYSVVSLQPEKRYLVTQGDYLTGKAIPNTQVRILITPPSVKSSVAADSQGVWSYQIPPDLSKTVYRISFGNFDKTNKLVTFQSYKFRVQSNISLSRITDTIWKKISGFFTVKKAGAQISSGYGSDFYLNVGLPEPQNPITLTSDQRSRFMNYFLPSAYTAAKIVGADWRLMAMFVYREDLIYNYLDNCLDNDKSSGPDADYDPNTPCTGWGIPQWQVGWGIYPPQWANQKLAEAIAVMRPGRTIQQIGQEVIDNSYDRSRYAVSNNDHELDPITYPDRFPDNVTLEEIIDGSQAIGDDPDRSKTCRPAIDRYSESTQDPKDCYMRQLLGILQKDPAISAYLLALMWKDLSNQQQVIKEIRYQWGEGFDLQIASNIIAGFDNESQGIDFNALITTPQVTMPVAVATPPDPGSPQQQPAQTEAVVSQDGNQLTDSELADKNLKVIVVVAPVGTNPNDFACAEKYGTCSQPQNFDFNPSVQDVKGVSTSEEVNIDPDAASNPSSYQLCSILKPIDFDVVIDADCVPLDQVIEPQIPTEAVSQPVTVSSCPVNPEEGDFECAEGVCRSTEFECSGGKKWFSDDYKNPQDSCNLKAKTNTGEFEGLSYHYDVTSKCGEPEPTFSEPEPNTTPDIPDSYDPDRIEEPTQPETPQQEPEQPAAEPENPSLDQTIDYEQ